MKRLLLIICLVSFVIPINSQEKIAEISFNETIIDYGTIENGVDGKRTFEFKNIGNAPLVFSRIFSSCGCTIPKKTRKTNTAR
jgi:hypothetical protein